MRLPAPRPANGRIVSTSALPEGLDSAGIDAFVAAAMRAGEDLYHLDEGALAGLDADLVVTQDLCAVCAVDVSVVDDALAHLGCTAEVLTIDPHTLDEVLASITTLGAATGHRGRGGAPGRRRCRSGSTAVARAGRRARRPERRGCCCWSGPTRRSRPGHWVPEMVTPRAAYPPIGAAGEKSVRVTWEQALASDPDVVVCAPCGYDLAGSTALARAVVDSGVLPAGTPVWAVDANASFARPGPRLVDGVESLARIFDPAGPPPAAGAARRLR